MIDPNIFDGGECQISHWFGNERRTTVGMTSSFTDELEYEPYTRYGGVIVESTRKEPTGDYPTRVWIPYANIISVTYTA